MNKGKGGAPDSPSSYRPLCMLNTIGKVMESMLRARLRKAIEEGGGLSEEQHGFREGHSTIDAQCGKKKKKRQKSALTQFLMKKNSA